MPSFLRATPVMDRNRSGRMHTQGGYSVLARPLAAGDSSSTRQPTAVLLRKRSLRAQGGLTNHSLPISSLHPQFGVISDNEGRTQLLARRFALLLPSSLMNRTGENVVRIEAEALRRLADRIAGPMAADFNRAVETLFCCAGRVVVTGMGKSGLIARKIAATLSSTGTPALYLHPAEALHGDLGMIARADVVIALSASGDTAEILELLPTIKRLGVPLITFTGDALHPRNSHLSSLAQAADIALDCSIDKEACSLGLAPTASTTTM